MQPPHLVTEMGVECRRRNKVNCHCRNSRTCTENAGGKKATPITGLWGPEGSGRLRLQITRHLAHEGGKVVTLMHWPLYPQEYPGTHF